MKKEKTHIDLAVASIGRYGAVVLNICRDAFTAAGFENGDVVEVRVNGADLVMPVVSGYFDVDNGELLMLSNEFDFHMMISRNNSNTFAQDYQIKISDPVTVIMKKKKGYLKEYKLRKLEMGTVREDYDSDEAFCNFRSVDLPGVKKNFLYRGFSPINPTDHRAKETDRLLSGSGVRTVINLDGEKLERRRQYPGYDESFYAGCTIVPIEFKFDTKAPNFAENMQQCIRTIAEEEGPFYIHCRYGRDRTGLICMVLEALCGVPLDLLIKEYMISFENIHGIKPNTEKWNLMAEKRAHEVFIALTGLTERDLNGEETRNAMIKMLKERCGVSDADIRNAIEKLSEKS